MTRETEGWAVVVDTEPVKMPERKRCSDFDWECAHVMCHATCHAGGVSIGENGDIYETDPADGYCPYIHREAGDGRG